MNIVQIDMPTLNIEDIIIESTLKFNFSKNGDLKSDGIINIARKSIINNKARTIREQTNALLDFLFSSSIKEDIYFSLALLLFAFSFFHN